MITGIVLVLLIWITNNRLDEAVLWVLGMACAVESGLWVNVIAKIFGAW